MGINKEFKKGDIVECINNHNYKDELTIGVLYEVTDIGLEYDYELIRVRCNNGEIETLRRNRFKKYKGGLKLIKKVEITIKGAETTKAIALGGLLQNMPKEEIREALEQLDTHDLIKISTTIHGVLYKLLKEHC